MRVGGVTASDRWRPTPTLTSGIARRVGSTFPAILLKPIRNDAVAGSRDPRGGERCCGRRAGRLPLAGPTRREPLVGARRRSVDPRRVRRARPGSRPGARWIFPRPCARRSACARTRRSCPELVQRLSRACRSTSVRWQRRPHAGALELLQHQHLVDVVAAGGGPGRGRGSSSNAPSAAPRSGARQEGSSHLPRARSERLEARPPAPAWDDQQERTVTVLLVDETPEKVAVGRNPEVGNELETVSKAIERLTTARLCSIDEGIGLFQRSPTPAALCSDQTIRDRRPTVSFCSGRG
jgi:hypothetical protein